MDAAAGNDHGTAGGFDHRHRLLNPLGDGWASLHAPGSLLEKVGRIVVGMGLHVLRQGDGDRTGLDELSTGKLVSHR